MQIVPLVLVTGGFLEFYNGGMDHGWCAGYSCLERSATFTTEVVTSPPRFYDMAFTGATPDTLSFHFLTANFDEKVVIGLWYESMNSRRVFWDGRRVRPLTERTGAGNTLRKPNHNDPCGSNVQIEHKVYVVICGGGGPFSDDASLKIETEDTIWLSVGLTVEEGAFYDDANTASYLQACVTRDRGTNRPC